jgi:hypothetical protein
VFFCFFQEVHVSVSKNFRPQGIPVDQVVQESGFTRTSSRWTFDLSVELIWWVSWWSWGSLVVSLLHFSVLFCSVLFWCWIPSVFSVQCSVFSVQCSLGRVLFSSAQFLCVDICQSVYWFLCRIK